MPEKEKPITSVTSDPYADYQRMAKERLEMLTNPEKYKKEGILFCAKCNEIILPDKTTRKPTEEELSRVARGDVNETTGYCEKCIPKAENDWK